MRACRLPSSTSSRALSSRLRAPSALQAATQRSAPPPAARGTGVTTQAVQFLRDLAMGSGGSARKPDAADLTDLAAPSPGVTPSAPNLKLATIAGGCFWSVELAYQRTPGVTRTSVGYSQGHTKNPTYEETCTGRTGHTEAVLVEYDPAVVSFDKLVSVLWGKIDPTQREGQGNDRGSQYRTGIYYHDEEQKAIALASREAEEKRIGRTIHTEVFPATQWYQGEGYHQQYLAKGTAGRGKQSAAKDCKDPIRCYG